MKRIAQVEKSFRRDDHPHFGSGDTIKVHVRIKEGDKERIQVFQGDVISRRGGGLGATFTVRKISSGIGVERVFPLHSPNIAKIERVREGQVRRKKLYYLRELTGKSARIKEVLPAGAKKAKTKASKAKKAEAVDIVTPEATEEKGE
jgi:large subunit ribosomal protein L19